MPGNSSPQWRMEAEYLQSCNCDYGCPCNFNALPTYGNCEALVAYHVRKGYFDNTSLDGVIFAWGLWWPKAIHMGDGVGALYVNNSATEEQVKAIEAITSGKYGGGVFAIFPSTFKSTLPTTLANIDFHYHPYDGWFTVEGAGEAKAEQIRNPVTGKLFEGELLLPNGIVFKRGTVGSVDWHWQAKGFSIKHEKKNCHSSIATYANEGCIA